jgi:hypothetical protein
MLIGLPLYQIHVGREKRKRGYGRIEQVSWKEFLWKKSSRKNNEGHFFKIRQARA